MPPETGAGYAVVAVDASLDDRHIGGLLDSAGLEGRYFSESTQWVFIDDFGTLKKIPLDSYRDEIESFDPRDNGFGERLRSFFVRDGKRFFFIPLADSGRSRKKLLSVLVPALGDIPFSFEILGYYRPFLLYFFLLVPAALGAVFLSGSPSGFAFQVFPLFGFVRGGPPALVLAALLAFFWALFRDPLNELFTVPRYSPGFYAGPGFRGLGEKLKPYRLNLLLVPVLLLLFGFVSFIGSLPPLPVWTGLASSWGLCFLSRAAEAERQKKAAHLRFNPVIMLPGWIKTVPLFPFAAVFAPAVLLSLLAPLVFPSLSYSRSREAPPVSDPAFLISPADYEEHLAFALSFSRRPLGSDSRAGEYFHYYLGDDGLIAGEKEEPPEEKQGEEIPPFPLEKLMEFLLQYNNRTGKAGPVFSKELISAALFFAVSISVFFLRPKRPLYS
jgi:hypothetical protein